MHNTPSGTRMRPTSSPLGRLVMDSISPTGSDWAATSWQARIISVMALSDRVRRSRRAASRPAARAAARSLSLAARMTGASAWSSRATFSMTRLRVSPSLAASVRAAVLAALASAIIWAVISMRLLDASGG